MKKFIILILAGLLLPAFGVGAVSYERTPAGYTISNPVSFELEGVLDTYPSTQSWSLEYFWAGGLPVMGSQCFTTNNGTLIENLPLRPYTIVFLETYNDTTLCGDYGAEGHDQNDTFEVVEAPEEPEAPEGILTLPTDFLASTTAYVGDIFGDIWILVALVIGFPLAFWVILKIENLIKKKDKTKFKRPKDLKEKNNWL